VDYRERGEGDGEEEGASGGELWARHGRGRGAEGEQRDEGFGMRDRPSPVSAAKCSLLRLLLLAREERNILNCFVFFFFIFLG
jgi:hypothetical protein